MSRASKIGSKSRLDRERDAKLENANFGAGQLSTCSLAVTEVPQGNRLLVRTYMHVDKLEPIKVSLEDLYLDPNNPRFWSEAAKRPVSDKKTIEESVQNNTFRSISKHGVEELFFSILRNGFLPLDRLVVRKLDVEEEAYVVLEGNRRLAALRELHNRIENDAIDPDDADEDYLEKIAESTQNVEVLLYEGEAGADISWLLQGIRHISGIKEWQPAQRAKLVADQIDEKGLGLREVGQMFGLSAIAVGRLYRAFKGLEQMKADEEYSRKADNSYFSLFEEAYRNQTVRKWLGWSDEESEFTDLDNLRTFYAWISPDEENDDRRRLHDPKHIKALASVIQAKKPSLMTKIDDHELGIEVAREMAENEETSVDWEDVHEKILRFLSDIPASAFQAEPGKYLESLEKIISQAEKQKKMANAIIED